MFINYRIVADLFDAKLARSIMSFAYRYSNIKERKPLKSQDRLDTVAHYDIDEIVDNIKKMMGKDSNAKRAYWHEQHEDVTDKLRSLEDKLVCPKCDKVKEPDKFSLKERAIKNPAYAKNRCKECKSIEDRTNYIASKEETYTVRITEYKCKQDKQKEMRKEAIRSRFRLWCKTGEFR